MTEFGVLTMATESDAIKAIGLKLSIKKHNPDVKFALACSKKVADKIGQHFDYVIEERSDLRGYEHKVYLDEYSPFEKTFFFDADILVFKDLQPIFEAWKSRAYTARGIYVSSGRSSFGLDRSHVLSKINKPELVVIGGAGHAYFEKPACKEVFDLARKITKNYTDYANPCSYADEDVMGIAMTILGLNPIDDNHLVGFVAHAKEGTLKIDVTKSLCHYENGEGETIHPTLVHFLARQGSLVYRNNLSRLFKENGINMEQELWAFALEDIYAYTKNRIQWAFKRTFAPTKETNQN